MDFRSDIIYEYHETLLHNVLTMLDLIATGALGGSILGLLLALARLTHLEKTGVVLHATVWLMRKIPPLYVTLFRDTPLSVQIIIWAYVWSPIFAHPISGTLPSGEKANKLHKIYGPLIIGSLALIASPGVYISKTFQAGIQSIDKGQVEAARSLGLNYQQAMRCAVLPQTPCRMLPPLASELITLLKDSPLLPIIDVAELLAVQKTISERYSMCEEPLYTVVLVYLVLTTCLGWMFLRPENRYNQPRR